MLNILDTASLGVIVVIFLGLLLAFALTIVLDWFDDHRLL